MASRPVSTEYLKAGEDYLAALQTLGMRPKFLGWGWERATERWLLVLVTSIVDAGGPLALNRLLMRAYNAEATPKSISPFIVTIFSPEIVPSNLYLVGEKFAKYIIEPRTKETIDKVPRAEEFTDDKKIQNIQMTFHGIDLEMINSYQNLPKRDLKYHQRREEWTKFKRNVEKLAA